MVNYKKKSKGLSTLTGRGGLLLHPITSYGWMEASKYGQVIGKAEREADVQAEAGEEG